MIAALIVFIQMGACLGAGAMILRLLGLDQKMEPGERFTFAFTLGMGVLGWAVFPLGAAELLAPKPLALLLAALCYGLPLLRCKLTVPPALDGWERLLLAALAMVAVADLIGALAPPTDADSAAYHFALPKLFLRSGGLVFTPLAVNGAIPLLIQMTYVPPLALGGELAMTLWTCLSGWAVIALTYVVLARHGERRWALAGALLVATTPAVLYGAGAGQVEVRMAAFVIVAVAATVESLRTQSLRWAIRWAMVAGLAAGFLIGSKYTSLLYALAIGLIMLTGKRPVARAIMFGVAAILAGCQWPIWNAIHTGDPLFPMLWGILPYHASAAWSDGMNAYFHSSMAGEAPVPRTISWWLSYPFVATLHGLPIFESKRTGFGPYVFLVLPFALAGAWNRRHTLLASPLLPMAVFVFLAYSLWFFIPSGQRVRHLLPIYPLLVVIVTAAIQRWHRPTMVTGAMAITLAIHGMGLGLFEMNFVQRIVRDESRDAFLTRMVGGYDSAQWANSHLGPNDRLFNPVRTINYYLNVPYFYAAHWFQGLVDMRATATDPRKFLSQLQQQGITYVLSPLQSTLAPALLVPQLIEMGCAATEAKPMVVTPVSRTLPGMGYEEEPFIIARLTADAPGCLH